MKSKAISIVVILILGVFLVYYKSGGFDSVKKDQSNQQEADVQGVRLVSPEEFSKLVKNKEAFLVDVHTPEQTHIPGTDALIPFDDISGNIDQLPEDKSTPILVYCRSGNMSRSASQEIYDLGYTNVYDLDGGVKAYKGVSDEVAVTPESQDLGIVVYGDAPTTEFMFTNYTSSPINITKISTSCECVVADMKKRNLASYESTKVNVSYNPDNDDATDLGNLTYTISIEVDNPDYPKFENSIIANVVKP